MCIIMTRKCKILEVRMEDDTVWELDGKCLRCGKCCQRVTICEHLDWENLNDVKVAVCREQHQKPWQCKLFPYDPTVPLLEGCGYSWRLVD